jgi:hypothetical protein
VGLIGIVLTFHLKLMDLTVHPMANKNGPKQFFDLDLKIF